jgi:3-methyladenine DNA glycosylase AlkD
MFELEALGDEQTKRTYMRHGGKEPVFGVKVSDLKNLIKKYQLKNNHELALELYATGNYDAMYLAGLIANSGKMTKETALLWLSQAYYWMLAEYTVSPVVAETDFAMELAQKLIDDSDERRASCGYSILWFYIMREEDVNLDKNELRLLLNKIEAEIHNAPNRVRYQMNNAVIAIGNSVSDLFDDAYATGVRIGAVSVEMGGTKSKTPSITEKLSNAKEKNQIGHKRKVARC